MSETNNEREIYVPFLHWLLGGVKQSPKYGKFNCYTASFGSDPSLGAIGQKIFNYRVWLEKVGDEQIVMKAAIYYGTKGFEAQNEDDVQVRVYEYIEESREQIREWVKKEADKFFSD